MIESVKLGKSLVQAYLDHEVELDQIEKELAQCVEYFHQVPQDVDPRSLRDILGFNNEQYTRFARDGHEIELFEEIKRD